MTQTINRFRILTQELKQQHLFAEAKLSRNIMRSASIWGRLSQNTDGDTITFKSALEQFDIDKYNISTTDDQSSSDEVSDIAEFIKNLPDDVLEAPCMVDDNSITVNIPAEGEQTFYISSKQKNPIRKPDPDERFGLKTRAHMLHLMSCLSDRLAELGLVTAEKFVHDSLIKLSASTIHQHKDTVIRFVPNNKINANTNLYHMHSQINANMKLGFARRANILDSTWRRCAQELMPEHNTIEQEFDEQSADPTDAYQKAKLMANFTGKQYFVAFDHVTQQYKIMTHPQLVKSKHDRGGWANFDPDTML